VILANENFFIIYGAWMETQFNLAATGLGLTSVVVSVAELAAAVLSAVTVDRPGKHRALFIGLAANASLFCRFGFSPSTDSTFTPLSD